MEAYCMKCRADREMNNPQSIVIKEIGVQWPRENVQYLAPGCIAYGRANVFREAASDSSTPELGAKETGVRRLITALGGDLTPAEVGQPSKSMS